MLGDAVWMGGIFPKGLLLIAHLLDFQGVLHKRRASDEHPGCERAIAVAGDIALHVLPEPSAKRGMTNTWHFLAVVT